MGSISKNELQKPKRGTRQQGGTTKKLIAGKIQSQLKGLGKRTKILAGRKKGGGRAGEESREGKGLVARTKKR